MTGVFNIPAITWALTAVLLLGTGHHALAAARSRHLTDRVNNSLHALMNALMAAMLWNLAASTTLAQVILLAGAALWFIIQAVARPEFTILCAGSQGRLKCGYHALTMAGAALMVAMMAHLGTPGAGAPAGGAPMAHTHHAMAAATPTTGGGAAPLAGSPALAIALTVLFGAAALLFAILLLRPRAPKTTGHAGARKRSVRAGHALEALGAAAMAAMFATMAT
ncbi:DUF5134 domain-containing protein [Arthrobacter sp. 35W]|uniref:DUF5134 domain-containing protein n=1 Tax=Arthrobacter sp. 35W TaxID=1132441 RepID=UPI00047CDB6E|nr:DUF5134 domain-containing protein [Arthrobacter sp. 35W]